VSLAQFELRQLTWRKAQCSMNNGDCVEVAVADGKVVVRDSKNPDGTWLVYDAPSWRAFLENARSA